MFVDDDDDEEDDDDNDDDNDNDFVCINVFQMLHFSTKSH